MNSRVEVKQTLTDELTKLSVSPELRQHTLERVLGKRRVIKRGGARLMLRYTIPIALLLLLSLYVYDNNAWLRQEAAAPIVESVPPVGLANKTLLPQYLPEGYEVEEITSSIPRDRTLPEITIRFSSEHSGTLELSRGERTSAEELADYKRVAIDGKQGWMSLLEDGGVVLIWVDEDYEYRLTGEMSEQEARKMAGSIKQEGQEGEVQ